VAGLNLKPISWIISYFVLEINIFFFYLIRRARPKPFCALSRIYNFAENSCRFGVLGAFLTVLVHTPIKLITLQRFLIDGSAALKLTSSAEINVWIFPVGF